MRYHSVVMLMLAVYLLPGWHQANADLFLYTDKDGTVVMVDDEGKIPRQYRKNARNSRSSAGGEQHTGVIVRGNKVIVPVTLNFRSETLQARPLLDTGASITTWPCR